MRRDHRHHERAVEQRGQLGRRRSARRRSARRSPAVSPSRHDRRARERTHPLALLGDVREVTIERVGACRGLEVVLVELRDVRAERGPRRVGAREPRRLRRRARDTSPRSARHRPSRPPPTVHRSGDGGRSRAAVHPACAGCTPRAVLRVDCAAVSLLELLPNALLRARTGTGFERGERYWREGRVMKYEVDGDRVTGVVAGAEDYLVRLNGSGKNLLSSRAVARSACAARRASTRSRSRCITSRWSTAPKRAARVPIRSDEPCFATDDELEVWANDHHVGFELETSAEILAGVLVRVYPSEWHLRRVLCTKSLGEVGSLDGCAARVRRRAARPGDRGRGGGAPREDRGGGRGRARRGAHRARRRAIRRSLPAWQQVSALRARLRGGGAMPRGRGEPRRWHVEVRARRRDDRVARGDAGARHQLHGDAGDRAARVSRGARCDLHVQARAVHARDRADRRDARSARRSGAHRRDAARSPRSWCGRRGSARSPSSRFRRDVPKPRAAIELWWQIEHELRELAVTPVVKRQLKKGGTSSGTRVSLQRLVAEHGNYARRARSRDRRGARGLASRLQHVVSAEGVRGARRSSRA